MLDESDYKVYQAPFPSTIKALVTMGEDSFYSIYVNSNLPFEVQKEAILHELNHILRDDFYNGDSIRKVES